eukprot:3614050-Prymnesium_polylepis.1
MAAGAVTASGWRATCASNSGRAGTPIRPDVAQSSGFENNGPHRLSHPSSPTAPLAAPESPPTSAV